MPVPLLSDPFDLLQRAAVLLADSPTVERVHVACSHAESVAWSIYDVPCGWVGTAEVVSYPDTKERLWECPHGHENYLRWES